MLPRTASWALHLQQEDEQEEELELREGKEKRDDEKMSGQTPVYKFSGNSAAKLPNSFLPSGTLRGDATFTIFFWFRAGDGGEGHHQGQLLCLSDTSLGNSRHQFSLAVRRCRLTLQRRRLADEGGFRPVEWRWSGLPQLCDGSWHHYTLTATPEEANLFIDGHQVNEGVDIVEDWRIHQPSPILGTTLMVGGCWHSAYQGARHMLRGSLAGLVIIPGEAIPEKAVACLARCPSSLHLPVSSLLRPGMQMVTERRGSQISIEGEDAGNLGELVGQVTYTGPPPAPHRRASEVAPESLRLLTRLHCSDGRRVTLPPIQLPIFPSSPRLNLEIKGTVNISRDYEELKRGVRALSGVQISGAEYLESCTITVFPPLNPDHETLEVTAALQAKLGLEGELGLAGGTLRGLRPVGSYERVASGVIYTNRKPAYYLNRQIRLVCNGLGGRSTNDYMQTILVIHPRLSRLLQPPPAHRQVSQHTVDVSLPALTSTSTETPLLLAALCLALLVAVLGFACVSQRARPYEDSEAHITLNPLSLTHHINK